ncbi:WD40-repeat-containing domain protein [Protomyces lactucae-debilis]|uniref:DNA damage-binding protein CMR1 n=1 Tax=Protomyces lactucae-debilis TaxID=2754530 RepID=A0A1Y2F671_PROLT|nr:WD40-repeat-containing domain protein [Protomyces lactucae-debilis]ORY79398.1 WD40-repeat-containing domain protein [Protomyces lactucae-debilis]
MNDYEAERLANIAKNEALLKEIGLTGIKAPSVASSNGSLKRKKAPARPRKKEEDVSLAPRRTSSRLSGIPAESEVARNAYEKAEEDRREAERLKRVRVAGPIALEHVIENGGTWQAAKSILAQAAIDSKREARDFETSDANLNALRKELNGLSLLTRWDPNEIKITPERVYSIGMHPGSSKKLAIAGDKRGHLGIWDIENQMTEEENEDVKPKRKARQSAVKKEESDAEEEDADLADDDDLPMIHHFKLHAGTITSFAFDPLQGQKLYTASYDGSIRCLDLASGVASEAYAPLEDRALTSLEVQQDAQVLLFSTNDGQVGRRDLRVKDAELFQLHDRKIGGMGMHPLHPHLICTASLDRSMKVWDMRSITKGRKTSGDPSLLANYDCRLSVSSAFFNDRGTILATAYDDTVKLFDMASLSEQSKPPAASAEPLELDTTCELKHNNQTGRWLTVFKAQWQATPLDGQAKFVIGNMQRRIDLCSGKGEMLASLEDERITAVPAVVKMHDSQNWVLAGNASGKALFFQ